MKKCAYIFKKIKLSIFPLIIRYYKKCMKKGKRLKGKYHYLKLSANYSKEDFKMIKHYIDNYNVKLCQKKKCIKIGFITYTSSMWNVDELYRLLNSNHRFQTDIIVGHFANLDSISSCAEYDRTFEYFSSLGYNVTNSKDFCKNNYDMLFYLTPFSFSDEFLNVENISFRTLVLHASYSYMLVGNMSKLNLWMYHLSYRYYTDSAYYTKLIEASDLYVENARYYGFAKMDQFYNLVYSKKILNKKVIIYAPHHSVNYTKFKSATFEVNYRKILEFAKKYSTSTYWFYKPHPLLKTHSVEAGIFENQEQYNQYEKEWDDLSNAEVVNDGNYFNVFKESDAMITDSVSFLAEYQFTHNPLLLLESGEETYNDFGKEIVSILYKCPGDDINRIDQFIRNVLAGNDELYNARKKFFDSNLNYMRDGNTANMKIYKDIISVLEK